MQSEIFLDTRQAAKFLKISKIRLYHLIEKKLIPHFKPAGKIYFRESDLIAWIEAGKKPAQTVANAGR